MDSRRPEVACSTSAHRVCSSVVERFHKATCVRLVVRGTRLLVVRRFLKLQGDYSNVMASLNQKIPHHCRQTGSWAYLGKTC